MRSRLTQALGVRCGGLVAGRLRALPPACTSSPRRRRFLFLALCAPSFVGVAALPFHRSLLALLAALVFGLLAWLVRVVSEPHFVSGDHRHA